MTTGIFLMMLGLVASVRLRSLGLVASVRLRSSRSLALEATGMEAAWLKAAGLGAVSIARGTFCC